METSVAQRGLAAWQHNLLEWFAAERRDLPWRLTRDPWAILVSEAMLQQTQVGRVLERWPLFLQQFPTAAACAAAPMADVVRAWVGLGYNRRAMNLHRTAVAVTEEHGGTLPDRLPDLLALPGVGPYTARAVLAFAFEQDVAVVDTNAARVFARSRAGRVLGAKAVQQLADASVPRAHGWVWNQAVLDFGAVICQKRAPRCEQCPLQTTCAWAAKQWMLPDPAVGTAGVTARQSPFDGSDRQGRGRLIDVLRSGPIKTSTVADAAGWPDDTERATRVLNGLIADGLVRATTDVVALA